jgi:hypothetical protein
MSAYNRDQWIESFEGQLVTLQTVQVTAIKTLAGSFLASSPTLGSSRAITLDR